MLKFSITALALCLACTLYSQQALKPLTPDEDFSVDFNDTPIREIIEATAKLVNRRVELPDTLEGSTSIHLKNVSWRALFSIILGPEGYDFLERDDHIEVMLKEDIENLPTESRFIEIYFQRSNELSELLEKCFPGKIAIEESSNGIKFSAHPRHIQRILGVIADADDPKVRLQRFPRQPFFPLHIPDLPLPDLPEWEAALVESEMATTSVVVLRCVDCWAVKRIIERELPASLKVNADYRSNAIVLTGMSAQIRRASALATYLDDKRWYHPPKKDRDESDGKK